MPDLGKYALEVGLAYGISAVLIVALIAMSVLHARRVAQQVEQAEVRRG